MWQIKICIISVFVAGSLASFSNMITTYDGLPEDCVGTVDTKPFIKVGSKHYLFGREKKVTWFAAIHICRSLSADLISIETKAEYEALTEYLKKNEWIDEYWISANDLSKEGNFEWLGTGNPVTFAKWSADQPDNAYTNENCVHLWYRANEVSMNDRICTYDAYYICQARNPKTIIFSVW
ncbi:C-type lectin 37Da-like [Teleopsis dalmanni]|uniref:C-type lectin 37Da-like n=1 Tax=Teleopsis dalmanni TaxID=139649 RepID=UPI0018CE6120|nr:C-type lectin 37Da-like [Teleopsis dalmanni]